MMTRERREQKTCPWVAPGPVMGTTRIHLPTTRRGEPRLRYTVHRVSHLLFLCIYQVGILAGLSQHLITQDCTIPTTRQSCAGIAKGVALAPSPSAHSPRHLHQARVHMPLSIVCARIPAQDPGNARDEISIIARADTQRPRWRHT